MSDWAAYLVIRVHNLLICSQFSFLVFCMLVIIRPLYHRVTVIDCVYMHLSNQVNRKVCIYKQSDFLFIFLL